MESFTNGRIPREVLHNQDERLNSKYIQTLSFLQEIANENRKLKQRIAQLEVFFHVSENKLIKKSSSNKTFSFTLIYITTVFIAFYFKVYLNLWSIKLEDNEIAIGSSSS